MKQHVACDSSPTRRAAARWGGLARRVFALAALLATLASGSPATAEDDALFAEYMSQLRSRGFYELAEGECHRRLAEDGITAERRVQLSVELARTFLQHGWTVGGSQQEELWQQADETLKSAHDLAESETQQALLTAEQAAVQHAHADAARLQWELWPQREGIRQTAAEHFSRAAEKLRLAVQQGEFSSDQMVRYRTQLVSLLLDWGRLHAQDAPERARLADEAEAWLGRLRPIARAPSDRAEALLLTARLEALRGRPDDVLRRLSEAATRGFSDAQREAATVLRVRALADLRQYAEALREVLTFRRDVALAGGELRTLNVSVLLELRELAVQANDTELAADFAAEIERHLERLDSEVGGYWAYRARRLWQQAQRHQEVGRELQQAMQSAAAALADGQPQTAIERYQSAYKIARDTSQTELAFRALRYAASIHLQQGEFQAALQQLGTLVDAYPEHPQTAEIHLLQAYAAGRLYAEQKTAKAREDYEALLETHLERYADQPSGGEAAFLLAELQRRRLQTSKALVLYRQVPSEHRRAPAAAAAIAACHQTILQRLEELGQPTGDWQQIAEAELDRLIAAANPSTTWKPEQAQVAVTRADFELRKASPDLERSGTLLDEVLAAAQGQADPAWNAVRTQATSLRMMSLAMSGRFEPAAQLATDLRQRPAESVIEIIAQLENFVPESETARRASAELRLQLSQQLMERSTELPAEQQRSVAQRSAQALLDTRQPQRATTVLRQAVEVHPDDPVLRRMLAQTLVDHAPEAAAEALALWQQIENAAAAGSQTWLEARYHVALCHYRLGRHDECRKLLGVAKLLYTSSLTDRTRTAFDELLAKCQNATADRRGN